MNKKDDKEYYSYLKNRSLTGLIYRKFYLYPVLSLFLKGKVLDVGCGIGDFLSFKKEAYGIDINKDNVMYCKNKDLNASLMQEDIIPFDDSSFDSAIIDNVIEHIVCPKKLLKELNRVLSSDGCLVIGVPGVKGFKSDPDHKKYYDINSLTKTLEDAEFKLIRSFNMPIDIEFPTNFLSQHCLYAIYKKFN
jgi:SAM-dependent methyltransferase